MEVVRLLLLTRDDDLRGGTHELCSVGFVLFSPIEELFSILDFLLMRDRHRGRAESGRVLGPTVGAARPARVLSHQNLNAPCTHPHAA